MSSILRNYNRESFFATVRANGGTLTPAEEERVHNYIQAQSGGGDIFSFVRRFFVAGWQVIQSLWEGGNSNISLTDRINNALDTGDRLGSQREVNELMHSLRDGLQQMGGNIARHASLITGDTSAGQGVMRGNLRDIAFATTDHRPEDLERGTRLDTGARGPQEARYAVLDTNEISAPPAANATRALTERVAGA